MNNFQQNNDVIIATAQHDATQLTEVKAKWISDSMTIMATLRKMKNNTPQIFKSQKTGGNPIKFVMAAEESYMRLLRRIRKRRLSIKREHTSIFLQNRSTRKIQEGA